MASTLLLFMLLGWTGVSLWAAHRTGLAWMQRAASDTAPPGMRQLLQVLVLAVLLPLPLLDELFAQSQFEALCRERLVLVDMQAYRGMPSLADLPKVVSAPEPVGGLLVAVSRQEHRYTNRATDRVLVRFSTYEAQGGKLARMSGHSTPLLFEGHCGPPDPRALLARTVSHPQPPQDGLGLVPSP